MQDGENAAGSQSPAALCESREKKIILLLCLLAAIHVFIFSAAFPFFNNVDEPAQFDLVLQYSHGRVPRGMEATSKEASVYLALFCSCAYLGPSAGPVPPPPWTLPVDKMQQEMIFNSAGWRTQQDYEASEPPLYYAVAGSWWHLGKWLGLGSGRLLYWLRFLNIPLVVALVWIAYAAARIVFSENVFVRIGVPALLAFMPQTAFYSIGNDVLSALCFGVVFICLLKWLSSDNPSLLSGAATGLAFAATFLSKMTNIPLLAVVAAIVVVKIWQDVRRRKFRSTGVFVAFFCCAVPPIVAWMLWCKCNYGDFTGSKLKMEHFGWTVKPLAEWWHHPIFTSGGVWTYLSGQLATFWQGEFKWYFPPLARPLVLPGTDLIYTVLSLVLLIAVLPALLPRFSSVTLLQQRALQLSLACFAAGLVFFALMSVVYDFHNCRNPSREHPYFTAGRMLFGALIPFLLLIVYGLDRVLNHFGTTTKFVTLAAMISTILVLEIATDWPVFSNPYNWFHLP